MDWILLYYPIRCTYLLYFTVETLPFGGVGNSGIGVYHGKYSYDTFTYKKSCLIRGYNKIIENVAK